MSAIGTAPMRPFAMYLMASGIWPLGAPLV